MKERTRADIDIFNPQGELIETVLITPQSNRVVKLMESDYITLKFSLAEAKFFPIGSYCDDELFGRFYITQEQMPKYNTSTAAYSYELRFDAWYYMWNLKQMMLTRESSFSKERVRIENSFIITGNLETHMLEVLCNMQALDNIPYSIESEATADTNVYCAVYYDKKEGFGVVVNRKDRFNEYHPYLLLRITVIFDTGTTENVYLLYDGETTKNLTPIEGFTDIRSGMGISTCYEVNIEDADKGKWWYKKSKNDIVRKLDYLSLHTEYDSNTLIYITATKNNKPFYTKAQAESAIADKKASCSLMSPEQMLQRYLYISDDVKDSIKALTVSYENISILDAITTLAQTYNCEYWIEGIEGDFRICFGKRECNEEVMLSLETNIESIEVNKDTSLDCDKLFAFGSTENLTNSYRQKFSFHVKQQYKVNATPGAFIPSDDLKAEFFNIDSRYIVVNKDFPFKDVNINYENDEDDTTSFIPESREPEKVHGEYEPVCQTVSKNMYYRFNVEENETYDIVFPNIHSDLTKCAIDIMEEDVQSPFGNDIVCLETRISFYIDDELIPNHFLNALANRDIDFTEREYDSEKDKEVGYCRLKFESFDTIYNKGYTGSHVLTKYLNRGIHTLKIVQSFTLSADHARRWQEYNDIVPDANDVSYYRLYSVMKVVRQITTWAKIDDFTLILKYKNKTETIQFRVSVSNYPFYCRLAQIASGMIIQLFHDDGFLNNVSDEWLRVIGLLDSSSNAITTTDIFVEDKDVLTAKAYEATAMWTTSMNDPSALMRLGEPRLRLPAKAREYVKPDYIDGAEYGYPDLISIDGYIIHKKFYGIADRLLKEASVAFNDIYPSAKLQVKEVTYTDEKTVEGYGDGYKGDTWYWRKYTFKVQIGEEERKNTPFAMKKDYINPNGEKLKVLFSVPEDLDTPGIEIKPGNCKLSGMQFEVELKETDQTYTIVRNDDFGCMLPNTELYPQVGDPCVLLNWNPRMMVSLGLVEAAENELLRRAFEYYSLLQDNNFTFTCNMMSDFFFNDSENYTVSPLGQRVKIHHDSLKGGEKSTRIIGMELKLDKPYDTPKLVCGETAALSRLKQIEKEITKLSK